MSFNVPPLFLTAVTIVVIVAAIVIVGASINHQSTFSKIVTVGPVLQTAGWTCSSDKDYVVTGALRGINNGQITISVSGLGSQSLYLLDNNKIQSFTVGSPGGHMMNITRTGVVTGWITMQTMSDANATCHG